MNALLIGSDKEPLLQFLPDHFLFIDDGPLIDKLDLPPRKAVTHFDVTEHSFNPLKDMTDIRAREFWGVLKAVFPEGENTLTKANAEFQILTALKAKPRKLASLIKDTKDTQYAYQMIQKLLLSDVLRDVLTAPIGPRTIDFRRTIIARLDRAVLGDFVCFVLAQFLISQFQGAIVVPDFGFYATPAHVSLLRRGRLIAGVNSFDEVPALRNQLLLVENKIASRCTPADAEILAMYASIPKATIAHGDFTGRAIGAA